ncbi:hypothetical protein LguiB_018327 [Lonicera macranthoides]
MSIPKLANFANMKPKSNQTPISTFDSFNSFFLPGFELEKWGFCDSMGCDSIWRLKASTIGLTKFCKALVVNGVDLALAATYPGLCRGTPLSEQHTLWSVGGPRDATYPTPSRWSTRGPSLEGYIP